MVKKVITNLHSSEASGPDCIPVAYVLTHTIHTLSSSAGKQKVVVIAIFLSKLDHRLLFNYIYYETILVQRLVSNMINKHHTLHILYTMLV